MPACEPVNETASWPRSWIAIAQSAFEIRSPVEMSMSYSRGCGVGETSCASRISSSVVSPIAESTATTFAPASRAAASRCATRFSLSVSPTDVPPNFITMSPGVRSDCRRRERLRNSSMGILRQCRRGEAVPGHFASGSSASSRRSGSSWSRGRSGSARRCARTTRPTAGMSPGPASTSAWRCVRADGARRLAPVAVGRARSRRRRGTLLVVDAWFDIVLESHADELRVAIMLAVVRRAPGGGALLLDRLPHRAVLGARRRRGATSRGGR